ncbi:MAG: hypothetical protein P8X90_31565, partial [Desulfobacterales bacterium]
MMQDFSDSIKHLRNIHLVFVLAAAAIAMALSSSDSIYKTAGEQVRDVVSLEDALTAKNIADSISETAGVPKDKNRLRDFIKESVREYLEAKHVYFDSLEVDYFSVDIRQEESFGRFADISPYERYYHLSQDENYWFGWQLCLLGDGKNLYAHPGDLDLLHVSNRTTLDDYSSLLNRLLQADTLYAAPTFHGRYFSEGPVAERYSGIPDEVVERLKEIKNVELDITLTKINLTDDQSRRVFKTSQGHAEEDPAGYTDYDFKFDTFTLEMRARPKQASRSGDRTATLSFNLELPIMFRLREPKFMAQALQKAPFDRAYYSRYISGARSFERIFPELAETTTHIASATPGDLELYLQEQAQSRGAPISLFGLQVSRDLIEVWGVLLMLCAQLYFCLHYRALISRMIENSEISFPWIGLYRDFISTLVFQ